MQRALRLIAQLVDTLLEVGTLRPAQLERLRAATKATEGERRQLGLEQTFGAAANLS